MKNAFLIGSGVSALPILFALKKRGVRVTVVGGKIDDPCHLYADESIYVDYSSGNDFERVISGAMFDFLVPTCNDTSYLACVAIANTFGLPGYDSLTTSKLLHFKDTFQKYLRDLSLPSPKHMEYLAGWDREVLINFFPVLIKPIFGTSGIDIVKIDTEEQFNSHMSGIKLQINSCGFIVEEFIRGSLHSHSAFIRDGEISVDFFVDEFCTVYPYQVNSSNHPSCLSDQLRFVFRECITTLIRALNINDGLLHTQFIVKNSESFAIIETMRRAPGDLFGLLIEKSTGINYFDLYIRPFIGEEISHEEIGSSPKNIGRHTVSTSLDSGLESFSVLLNSQNIEIFPLKEAGVNIKPAPHDKAAIIFCEFNSSKEMYEKTPYLSSYIRVNHCY